MINDNSLADITNVKIIGWINITLGAEYYFILSSFMIVEVFVIME